jgi:hypothetical protein
VFTQDLTKPISDMTWYEVSLQSNRKDI